MIGFRRRRERAMTAMVVVAALTASGCTADRTIVLGAAAEARSADRAPWNGDACAMTVRFGSFATGIDGKAAARVERLIADQPGVTGVARSPPGIEGEYSIRVRTTSSESAARLFDRLGHALATPVRAPVSLTGPDGSTISAPLEQRRRTR